MSRFRSPGQLASWAGLCPGNHESARKRRRVATTPGNSWLRRALIESARAAARTKGSYFGAQYRQIARRRGPNKAAVAVAHSLLDVIWHMLTTGEVFADPGEDYFTSRHDKERQTRRLISQLKSSATPSSSPPPPHNRRPNPSGQGSAPAGCRAPADGRISPQVEHRLFSAITMNWRGRPLTSHEVIVQTIAATTTATGLRVHAELDTSTYNTGVKVSDRQMDALPLARHDWHGDWNYTLRPEAYDQISTAPDPFDRPSPDLAWLHHPALTGLPAPDWDALIPTLMALHDQQRETSLDARRGHRPRLTAPGTSHRPVLTLADRLLATVLHQRLALPQVAIAALFSVRPETINKRIRDIRQLLGCQATPYSPGHTGSQARMIFTSSRPQKASPSHRGSIRRVNDLRALKAGGAWSRTIT